MRNTLPSSSRSSSLFFNTISSAWSHGTSSSTMVRVPCTLGSSTTLSPLISWIRRKKSFKSTSFRLTEMGSPVYLGRVLGTAVAACGWNDIFSWTSGFKEALVGVVVSKTASDFTGSNFAAASVARASGSGFAATGWNSGVTTANSTGLAVVVAAAGAGAASAPVVCAVVGGSETLMPAGVEAGVSAGAAPAVIS